MPKITDLPVAALDGSELLLFSKPSPTTTITATTIGADATDNSFNDSGSGFIAAGFAVADRVLVSGFGTAANNFFVGVVASLTAGKMGIGGVPGDEIVTEAAGASVTITKWDSYRATAQEISELGGGDVAVDDDGVEVLAAATRLNFTGAGVTVTDGAGGIADIDIPGGGGPGAATINAQTGTSYTLALTDANNVVTMSNAAANTLTVPTNAAVAFPIGTVISVVQFGAGVTTVSFASVNAHGSFGPTANFTSRYGAVSLLKIGTNEWVLAGDHTGVS